ncbi:hypothetical protein FQN52_007379 [Onygenales sp. PD_12]|nr:hypothetical protein FQN52_007379 [Onygenales sp. PD_12]
MSQSPLSNSPSASHLQKGRAPDADAQHEHAPPYKADDMRDIKDPSLNTETPTSTSTLTPSTPFPPSPSYNPPLPLTIPSKSQSLSSGFPYHPALFPLHIPPDQWAEFSAQLVDAAKPTLPARVAAVGAGIGAALVTPLHTGYYIGKWVRDKSVVRRVGREMGREGSGVNRVLGVWNENVFRGAGVVVRLVVPGGEGEGDGEGDGEVGVGEGGDGKEKTKKASAVKNLFERRDQSLTFRLVVSPLDWEGEGEGNAKAAQELGSAQPVYEMAAPEGAMRFVAELDATSLEGGKGRVQELPT